MKTKKYNGFTHIKSTLTENVKNQKLQQGLYKFKAMKYWDEIAPGFFEDAVAKTRAIDFKNGVLVVACLSRELAYQIKLLAQRLISEINHLLGKTVVFAIHIES